jgi:hypothetical protein
MSEIKNNIVSLYNKKFKALNKRVVSVISSIKDEKSIDISTLDSLQIKELSSAILEIETKKLQDQVEGLLTQKEKILRELDKKLIQLQDVKYSVFNAMETTFSEDNISGISKLHQVKLQSIDLFDLLSETVESAIITALENSKDNEVKQTIQELIKELTYETIKEGTLNTIRIRKILSTILQSAVDIAEATPNMSTNILEATLKGMRTGLTLSIARFKQRLAFMPLEAKHILIKDYDTIIEDLNQADTLFLQVVQSKANDNSTPTRKELLDISNKMRFDLEELINISKETAQAMKSRFSTFAKSTMKKADTAINSDTAKEAKRMGIQAWGVAKSAVDKAIKSAKEAMDDKDK